jgi:hypothetical protein
MAVATASPWISGRAGRHSSPRTKATRSPAKSTAPAQAGSTHSSVARLERTKSSSSACVRSRIAQIAG